MAQVCRQSVQVCRLRASKLGPSGEILPGAGNLYVSDSVIELGIDFTIKEGVKLEQRNGCDDLCTTVKGCDTLDTVTLSMNLCHLDAELIQLLTGGTSITSGGSTIGYAAAATSAACPNGVGFEVWTKRWNGASQDASLGYWQWGFPKVTWRMGSVRMANEIMVVPVVGIGSENALFNNGPADDWPVDLSTLFGFFATNTIPAASCGVQSTPAQAS